MKLLMIYTSEFSYETSQKSLQEIDELESRQRFEDVQLALIQMEEHDEENPPLKKSANFIKWLSRKHPFKEIVLHSFSHLSESKADPTFAADFLNQLEEKLQGAGFVTHQTPYGYFLNLDIKAPGFSLARVFKSF